MNPSNKGIIPKRNQQIWWLSKIRDYMTESMAIKVFKSMVAPYLDYGDINFMGGNKG